MSIAVSTLITVNEIAFVVYGEPAPRGSKIVGRTKGGRTFVRDSSKRSYPWMDDVAQAAGIAMMGKHLLTGPVRVELDFYQARPKGHYGSGKNAEILKPSAPEFPIVAPDAGKLARGTQDAMKSIVYRDDSQIVDERHRKFYGTPARCEVRIFALASVTTAGQRTATAPNLRSGRAGSPAGGSSPASPHPSTRS